MDLSKDFQAYVVQNQKGRRRAILYLWIAVFFTLTSSIACIGALLPEILGPTYNIPDLRISALGDWGRITDPENALNLASFSFNFVVASIARYWFLRQDKLTALLTEALVLEDEKETAIKVLLSTKLSG